ncbi:MAG: PAS domain-containing protein, partial [Myxococcota bacterium]
MQRQHEQLELFRRLASTGIIGLVVANREGTITEANAAVLRAVGFSADEVERGELNWDRLLAPPHLERHRQVVETLGTATTGAEASNCARGSAEYNVELLHRSGPSVAARLATARLSGDGDYATCVVFTDGERALREQVAEQSKELRRYEAIAAIWPAPIFAKEYSDDKNGVYILANPVAHAIMGTTEVLGLSDYDFFPPPEAEALQKADRDVIAGGKPVTVQEALPDTRKNGGTAHFMTTKLPLRDSEGKLYASAGLAVDIT